MLARELGADVLPVYIHGAGHVLPKKDFMLREGRIDVEVGQRMDASHPIFEGTLLESTKRFPGEFPLYQTHSSCPYHVAATLLSYNNLSQLQYGNSFPCLLLCQHEKPKMSSSHRFRLNGILLVLSCEKFPPLETRTARSTKSKLKEQEAQIL